MLKKYDGTNWNTVSYGKYFSGTEQFTNSPVVIRSLDQSVQAYTIKGNTQTSGTPSPSNPITIEGVGEETANLFDYNSIGNIYPNPETSTVRTGLIVDGLEENADYYLSFINPNLSQIFYARFNGNTRLDVSSLNTRENVLIPMTGANAIRFWVAEGGSWNGITNIMLNKGSTALPYEPYGKYKISILKDLQPLTAMYFSQQLMHIGDTTDDYSSSGTATYNIKKLVLTGQESFWSDDGTTDTRSRYRILPTGADTVLRGNRDDLYCTHFKTDLQVSANSVLIYNGTIGVFIYFYIPTADYPTLADFKTYLQQQYAAGTPVTVYYILATPTTETVTAPTITTTGGTVTLDIDTTVKPSEIDLTYHGWHEHQPLKRENGQWV